MAQSNYIISTTALDLTPSGTTVVSGNTQSATFVVARTMVRTGIGAGELDSGTQNWVIDYTVSAMVTPYEMYFVLQRRNSAGTVQSTSSQGTTRSSTGTFRDTISWASGTWSANDQLALVWYHRRPSGSGNKSGTVDANGASLVTAPTPATTTTTSTSTSTSTTTSTSTSTTTTTTTLLCDPTLSTALDNQLVFSTTLAITPDAAIGGANSFGSGIVENASYIFFTLCTNNYLNHVVYRYTKAGGAIATQTLTVQNSYTGDNHKLPAMIVTSSGSLLVAIETLAGSGSNTHNSAVQVFRWSNPANLASYTSTLVGNTTTERLAYPFLWETSAGIVLDCRRYSGTPPYRFYYVSTDDGANFGTKTEYITYDDSDYWMYAGQTGNNRSGNPILGITPLNDNLSASCYKFLTYLRTDFTGNFYSLDGTNLGTNVSGTELRAEYSWGDTVKDTDLFYARSTKIFGGFIYGLGLIGTRTSGSTNITQMQLFKVSTTTGAVTTGSAFSNKWPSTAIPYFFMFNVLDKVYVKASLSGKLYYYEVAEDLSDMTLMCTEQPNFSAVLITDLFSELHADYDTSTKEFRVFRGDDPDTVWSMTTTTTTTAAPTTTTTSTTAAATTTTTSTSTSTSTSTTTSTSTSTTTTSTTLYTCSNSSLVIASEIGSAYGMYDTTPPMVAQVFNLYGIINAVYNAQIVKTGNPSCTIVGKIYEGSISGEGTSISNTLLGTSTNSFDVSTTPSQSILTFTFNNISVSGECSFVIVASNIVTLDSSNYYGIYHDIIGDYSGGHLYYLTAGNTIFQEDTNGDLRISICYTATTTTTSTTAVPTTTTTTTGILSCWWPFNLQEWRALSDWKPYALKSYNAGAWRRYAVRKYDCAVTTTTTTTTVAPTTTTTTTVLATTTTTTSTSTSTSTTTSTTTAAPTTTTTTTPVATTTTTTTSNIDLLNGLISCYEFDESSGTTVNDAHTNNHDGTTNALVNQTGVLNKAYTYNGSSQSTLIDGVVDWNFDPLTESYTVNLWVKSTDPTPTSANVHFLVRWSGNAGVPYPFVWYIIYNSSPANNIWMAVNNGSVTSYPTIPGDTGMWDGNWHMLTMIVNSANDTIYAYVDGSYVAEQALGFASFIPNDTVTRLRIGANSAGTTAWFSGSVDQFAVWSRVLTASELSALYNSGSGLAYTSW